MLMCSGSGGVCCSWRITHSKEESKALLKYELEPVFRLKKHHDNTNLQESAGVTKEEGLNKLDPAGVSQHEEPPQNKVIKDMQEAISWLRCSHELFQDVVQTPDFLLLGEDESQEALTRLSSMDSVFIDEDERDDILSPFTFKFGNGMDMELFIKEMVDARKLSIFTIFISGRREG
ncbi:uncharacterized protein LOC143484036 [Brachyhypopomus gauderio]|uniref:uncharacterized protein LOC143484036 n=1 Tax=Brachyhypopomus gauderio TaxID=698409 RepID=UPI004041275A